jgi:hypothetical protein
MITHRSIATLSCALLLTSVWACSDSTAPTQTPSDAFTKAAIADLAPSAGEDVAADLNFYTSAGATAGGATFDVTTEGNQAHIAARSKWVSPLCSYDDETQFFICPTVTWFFHTYSAKYQLLDANDTPQSDYDNSTTAAVHFIASDTSAISWDIGQSSFNDTSSRHLDVTLSGLEGAPDTVHVWDGTGSGHIHSQRTGQISRLYDFVFNDTTSAVRIRQPRNINPYPLSGTIVKNYTVTRERQASDTTTHTTTIRVMVTFNGTASVPMMVGDTEYLLNLDTRRVTKQ